MPLPGRLTVSLLEEDNPVKTYFRIKPVCTLDAETYHVLEGIEERYPENGYIRVVPDKNELSNFKNRMRGLGGYCALDLRNYPGENEKIRPNKNYGVNGERISCIVYSDVIGRVPCEAAVEVLDAQYVFAQDEVTLRTGAPGTRYVLISREGQISGPWVWSDTPNMAGCISLKHAPEMQFQTLPREQVESFYVTIETLNGGRTLMTKPSLFGIDGPKAPQVPEDAGFVPQRTSRVQGSVAEKEQTASVQVPQIETAPKIQPDTQNVMPEKQSQAPAESEIAVKSETEPKPETETQTAPKPEESVQSEHTSDESNRETREAVSADHPWIHKAEPDEKYRAVSGRASLREQVLQAQSGINPRRGRSLSEVVDQQWRKSRYEQLGHVVPPEATGHPVLSPIDRAKNAVLEAWGIREARGGLLKALLSEEDLREALSETLYLNVNSTAPKSDKRMEELEAERLKLLSEIDALRIRRSDMKAQLMEDLRKGHQRDFETLKQRNQALQAQIKQNETQAEETRQAAEAAKSLLELNSSELRDRMTAHTAAVCAVQRSMEGRTTPVFARTQIHQPSPSALVSDIRVYLEKCGINLDNVQTVNLLLSLITGGVLVLSGPAGSGKTFMARKLAESLGLTQANGRFVRAVNAQEEKVRQLMERLDSIAPSMLLLDDANMPDAQGAMEAAVRLSEQAAALNQSLLVVLTVQDMPDGLALPVRLLSRAFFIRMDVPEMDQAWKRLPTQEDDPARTVDAGVLKQVAEQAEEVPGAIGDRLNTLCEALGGIGYRMDPRTLNEMWIFCAAMCGIGRAGEMQALDLALSQRALPAMLAGMQYEQLVKLPNLLPDMPLCLKLMEQPLPLPPL